MFRHAYYVMVIVVVLCIPEGIAIIALPDSFDIFNNFNEHQAVASGFGFKKDDDTIEEDQYLSFVNMTVIPNEVYNVMHMGQIRYSHLCTGASTCTGDSSGPLAITLNNELLLIGVTSVNLALDCEGDWPAVYSE